MNLHTHQIFEVLYTSTEPKLPRKNEAKCEVAFINIKI